jgi:hypothetical protein
LVASPDAATQRPPESTRANPRGLTNRQLDQLRAAHLPRNCHGLNVCIDGQ